MPQCSRVSPYDASSISSLPPSCTICTALVSPQRNSARALSDRDKEKPTTTRRLHTPSLLHMVVVGFCFPLNMVSYEPVTHATAEPSCRPRYRRLRPACCQQSCMPSATMPLGRRTKQESRTFSGAMRWLSCCCQVMSTALRLRRPWLAAARARGRRVTPMRCCLVMAAEARHCKLPWGPESPAPGCAAGRSGRWWDPAAGQRE